jgi:dTDP-4-amino-4,6-dideoxygalactose transaminase
MAARVRSLRQYGWRARYEIVEPHGRNSRIDEVQAALLRLGLPQLDVRNERRRQILRTYREAAPHLRWITGNVETVAHLAVLRSLDRPSFQADLAARGISTAVHYPVADHHQAGLPAPARPTDLGVTERLVREVVSVPCHPDLHDAEIARIADALAVAVP